MSSIGLFLTLSLALTFAALTSSDSPPGQRKLHPPPHALVQSPKEKINSHSSPPEQRKLHPPPLLDVLVQSPKEKITLGVRTIPLLPWMCKLSPPKRRSTLGVRTTPLLPWMCKFSPPQSEVRFPLPSSSGEAVMEPVSLCCDGSEKDPPTSSQWWA